MTKINVPISGISKKKKTQDELLDSVSKALAGEKKKTTKESLAPEIKVEAREITSTPEEQASEKLNNLREIACKQTPEIPQFPTKDVETNPGLYVKHLHTDEENSEFTNCNDISLEKLLKDIEKSCTDSSATPADNEIFERAKHFVKQLRQESVIDTATDVYRKAVNSVDSFLEKHKAFPKEIAKAMLLGEYEPTPKDLDIFERITNEMHEIYLAKNHDYGQSFDKTWDKFGMTSLLIRLNDKLNRLETLVNKEQKVGDESLRDTLLDLANYAILGLIKLRETTPPCSCGKK